MRRASCCRSDAGQKPLTRREREVLNLISEGYSNKQGALRMQISPRTFESHRAEAMRKLGARNTADLVRAALLQPLDSTPSALALRSARSAIEADGASACSAVGGIFASSKSPAPLRGRGSRRRESGAARSEIIFREVSKRGPGRSTIGLAFGGRDHVMAQRGGTLDLFSSTERTGR